MGGPQGRGGGGVGVGVGAPGGGGDRDQRRVGLRLGVPVSEPGLSVCRGVPVPDTLPVPDSEGVRLAGVTVGV